MNIKQLVEKPVRFTAGHRLCAGCAAPIIMKSVLAATDKPVIATTATGCLEVASTIYPYSSWNIPWMHSAFENAAATASGMEAAYKALKRRGKVKGDIKFLAIAGDGGTHDIGIQAISGALERGHDFVFLCYDNEAYMNCLSTSSLIMTKDGLKKVTEIKKGDEIYAFDQTCQPVLKKCTGVFDNGKREVFELGTLHHSIKATANHPFLVLKRNGRGKKNDFIWKTLSEIKIGDEIVVLKNLNTSKSYRFNPIRESKVGDYKVTHVNKVILPKQSSPELMKYLGIYVGDGWVRIRKNGRGEIGFSLPEKTKERKVLIDLHSKIFGSKVTTDEREVHASSVNLAKFMDSLGFGKGSKNKIIPPWVFTLPKKEKEAFLEGLMLSDGNKQGRSLRYGSSSYELLQRLRLLLQTMGWRVGKIHWYKIKKGKKCVYRELLKDTYAGYICFSKRSKWNIKKYPSQYRYQNFLIENEHFEMERIRNIKSRGEEPTLDLRVEGEHNFLANGIVVHNTGGQRSAATPYGANTTTEPAGKVKPGKEVWKKDLIKIVAAHNIPYAAQASICNLVDLTTKAQKAFEVEGPTVLLVLAPCTPLWGFSAELTVQIAKLATETCFWPLYEVVDGEYKLNYKPSKKLPITEFMKTQKRFKHLFKPENKHIIDKIQRHVDEEWDKLLKLCGEK